MKKSIFIAALLLTGSITVMAQGGGFQQRTVPERVQVAHAKLDSAFKLQPEALKQVDETFTAYYTAQDKLREEARAGGGQPDFQAMREKMQPLMDARDKKLKEILGDANYKIWKDAIEPTMVRRPRNN
jgi:hypothetical protein